MSAHRVRTPGRDPLLVCAALAALVLLLPAASAQRDPAAEELFGQANDLYANKFYDLAAEKFLAFVTQYPQHANASLALYSAGECRFQQDQFAEALPLFERVAREYAQSEDVEYALYRIGFCKLKLQDYAGSQAAFERLLREYPQSDQKAAASYWLGEARFRQGQHEQAIAAYRASLEAAPKGEFACWALYSIGFIQADHLNQPQEALATLQQVLRDFPDSPAAEPARKKLADAQIASGDIGAARQQFEEMARSNDPAQREEGLLGIAGCYYAAKDWPQAETAYRKLLADFPQSPKAPLAQLRIAHALYEQGKYDAASEAYGLAAAQGGDTLPEALRWQGAALEAGGKKAEAKAAYQRVITEFANSPAAPGAAQALGALLLAEGDLDGAERAYRLAADSADTYYHRWALYGLAWVQHRRKPDDPAGAGALAALAKETPDDEVGLAAALDAGRLFVDAKAYDQAIPLLQGYLTKVTEGERAAQARFALGRAQQGLQKSPEAIAAFEGALTAGLPKDLEAAALAALVDLYRAAGDDAKADATVARLQRDHPESPAASVAGYDQAEAAFRAGRYDEAQRGYQAILDRTPQSPLAANALCGLGSCALAQGDFAKAADLFQQVLDKYPGTDAAVFAQFRRSIALARAGKAEEAAAALDAFLRDHADSQWAAEAKRELAWAHIVAKQDDRAKPLLAAMAADAQGSAETRGWATFHLGEIAYRAEDYPGAQARYDEVIASYADSSVVDEAQYKRGWALLKQDKKDEAVTAFEACLAANPEPEVRADCLRNIGYVLYGKQQYREAAAKLQPFLTDLRETTYAPRALLILGLSATALQDWPTAQSALEAVKPGDDKALAAEVDLGLGRALRQQNKPDEAVPHLEAAAADGQGLTKVYATFELAAIKAAKGNDKDAGVDFLTAAARLTQANDPLAPQAYYLAGEAFDRAGDAANAKRAFETAVEKFPADNEWVQKAKAKLPAA